MLNAKQITKKFEVTEHGYNSADVDRHLKKVQQAYKELTSENIRLQESPETLREEKAQLVKDIYELEERKKNLEDYIQKEKNKMLEETKQQVDKMKKNMQDTITMNMSAAKKGYDVFLSAYQKQLEHSKALESVLDVIASDETLQVLKEIVSKHQMDNIADADMELYLYNEHARSVKESDKGEEYKENEISENQKEKNEDALERKHQESNMRKEEQSKLSEPGNQTFDLMT
ncbi:hypothetical protein MTQ93_09700 [Staphylococcus agnetis]|uniref:hypothetical protein n=1 Tax=Staphylococcus agnetis TaxID=985762 RepID=UPI00208FD1F2|nr:hypothetical protein [Staphylococcus agnetis]MCO4346318.1 hypothetical protein [Staphylococcus agnetis]MCO4360606.1 hypothetical protein [Staphylococcus agnetis]